MWASAFGFPPDVDIRKSPFAACKDQPSVFLLVLVSKSAEKSDRSSILKMIPYDVTRKCQQPRWRSVSPPFRIPMTRKDIVADNKRGQILYRKRSISLRRVSYFAFHMRNLLSFFSFKQSLYIESHFSGSCVHHSDRTTEHETFHSSCLQKNTTKRRSGSREICSDLRR